MSQEGQIRAFDHVPGLCVIPKPAVSSRPGTPPDDAPAMNPVDAATALLVTQTRLERDAAQEQWASTLTMADVLVSRMLSNIAST